MACGAWEESVSERSTEKSQSKPLGVSRARFLRTRKPNIPKAQTDV